MTTRSTWFTLLLTPETKKEKSGEDEGARVQRASWQLLEGILVKSQWVREINSLFEGDRWV